MASDPPGYRARRKLAEAGAVIDARLTEEHDSKVVLQQLENIPHGTAEFSKTLIHLQAAVLKHAELEETEEFTLLRDELDAEELRKLTAAVKVAESIAPTHPHPGVESSLANFAAGPIASLIDRSRNALRSAMA